MYEYESVWWSMEVASGWLADESPECITFCREGGTGALQISAYERESGIVPEDDVRDFIRGELPDEAILQQVSCGEFIGSGLEYVDDGKFWLKRWLRSGPVLLYVTFASSFPMMRSCCCIAPVSTRGPVTLTFVATLLKRSYEET